MPRRSMGSGFVIGVTTSAERRRTNESCSATCTNSSGRSRFWARKRCCSFSTAPSVDAAARRSRARSGGSCAAKHRRASSLCARIADSSRAPLNVSGAPVLLVKPLMTPVASTGWPLSSVRSAPVLSKPSRPKPMGFMRRVAAVADARARERLDLVAARLAGGRRRDVRVDVGRRRRHVRAQHRGADHVAALRGRRLVGAPVPDEEHAEREQAAALRRPRRA